MSIAGEIAEKREVELKERIAFLEYALMYHVGFIPDQTPNWREFLP